MSHKFIVCDAEKCTGCGLCKLICSIVKEEELNPILSRIHVVRIGPLINTAVTCVLCEDPPCVKSCPREALRISEETGVILVDEDKCTGCCWCIEACDFGALTLHMNKKVVVVCDLCGMDPKCIQICPTEALTFGTANQINQKARRKTVKKLFRAPEEKEMKPIKLIL